jgi:Protein kinase domain
VIGQTNSHYRVLEKIGAGGMGVVYRAHDERLDRDVALKVLRQHSLSDAASRRHFRKEALTLSKLNHPNIAIVFDFDAENDTDFLVTEYVPGVTLDAKLATGHCLRRRYCASACNWRKGWRRRMRKALYDLASAIGAEAGPSDEQILNLTARSWQGPTRSFFFAVEFLE